MTFLKWQFLEDIFLTDILYCLIKCQILHNLSNAAETYVVIATAWVNNLLKTIFP